MKLLADASIPHVSEWFQPPFSVQLYNTQDELHRLLPNHTILLCRSTLSVTAKLLDNTPIQCVATASSGTDHIDTKYLIQQGIPLLDAKGCNAEAVSDYVLASLAWLQRENQIAGKRAGVIGLGEIGTRVANRLTLLGFDVVGYDPLKETARIPSEHRYTTLQDLAHCDLICIHASLHNTKPYPSLHLLATDFFNRIQPGAAIINAARGGIVHEASLLQSKQPITYCTDVYEKEPSINPKTVAFATLCTPHIAGHSVEGKEGATRMVAQKIHRLYGLTPTYTPPLSTKIETNLKQYESWQDYVLSLYNPHLETEALKAATDKTEAYLRLRKAHQNRHDFNWTVSL